MNVKGMMWGVFLASGAAVAGWPAESSVPIWTRFEAAFQSERTYENPLQEIELRVRFTAPSGKERTVLAFWDGGQTWRVRYLPDEVGSWKYVTDMDASPDNGLSGKSGSFTCVEYKGKNPLYEHGAIRVAPNHLYLMHADSTPFFWLADTAWNGALKASEADWSAFLDDRVAKRFTAMQFVVLPWRAAFTDREGQVGFTGKDKVAVNPAFFQRMDRYFDLVNEKGLVALPVLLWAIKGDINPGWSLPEDQAALLVRYMVARYGAHHVVWILAGDGNYTSPEAAQRWLNIGRDGLKYNPGCLTTMHPGGMQWPWDLFRDAAWLDILTYQSGHGNSDASRKWNCVGPPATKWREEPRRPVINAEPNYEGHHSYQDRKPFTDYHVRRAAYWSLLATPTAGLTYGAHGIWSWEETPAEPLGHKGAGEARPWREAMAFPGSTQLKYMRDLFDRLPWWQLRPADEIILDRPDDPGFLRYVKAAKTDSGEWAVAYLPDNDSVTVDVKVFGGPVEALWFNPKDGKYSRTIKVPVAQERAVLKAPAKGDWVLILHRQKTK